MGFAEYSRLLTGLNIAGLVVSVCVLIISGLLALTSPAARAHLDRVSFRLLAYALVSHTLFTILGPILPYYTHPGWQCSLLAFLLIQLVLVYNFNGQRMEKYYVLGTILFNGVCLGAPYAAGRLGLDRKNHICWYRDDQSSQMGWVFGSQIAWMLLISLGDLVMFLIVVGFLVPYVVPLRKISSTVSDSRYSPTRLTIVRLRGIILASVAVFAFYQVKWQTEPSPNRFSTPIALALVAYCGRPLIYSLIAATDPSFISALGTLRRKTGARSRSGSFQPGSVILTTFVDLSIYGTTGSGVEMVESVGQSTAEVAAEQKSGPMSAGIALHVDVEPAITSPTLFQRDFVRHI
ncbi:hypothetical protein FB45DRAFT_932438 [Roridomyces roridus]|uniref:Uncharacterized protein n=1 Tax=Roridomyces roridus TaxID=1738132 RepID=A0AAD7BEN7_9AGAR|nr:hypothetical protein FB45DRAFT_932438 [Roridomyces roridus]